MANKKPSIEELKSKAEGGDVESQKMLGDIYLTPRLQYGFIKPNKNEGIKWYRLAADQGDVDAMFIVGKLLWSTTTLSIHYLKKAAELGHSEARYRLAMQCFKAGNQVEALRHYEIAMDDSKLEKSLRAECAFKLGASYEFDDVPEIYIAIEYYEQAYEWGNSKAAYNLGRIYEEGCTVIEYGTPTTEYEVIKRDLKKASHWYLKSAEMGYADGMHKCAEWYKHGNGFLKNYEKAFDWILKAACHDQVYCANLSEYFQYGIGVDENIYEAYVWAVIAGKHFRAKALSVLENTLPKKEVLRAQREAEKRVKICENYSLDGAAKGRDLYNYMREILKNTHPAAEETTGKDHKAEITGGANVQEPQAELPVSTDPDPDPRPDPGLPALLKDWMVAGVSSLTFHVNLREKNVRIVYGRKSKTLTNADFARLFTRYALPLIVDHHESQRSSKPPVDYASPSLARGVDLTLTRPNHKAVSDVNSRIRSVFGLGKKEQAFKWISANRHDTKTLKANIKIEVHY